MQAIQVIAVSGSGRTGSTLLSLLLSQDAHVFNLGQLRDLWLSYANECHCSCDNALPQCPVLGVAVKQVFGPDVESAMTNMSANMQAFFKDASRLKDWGSSDSLRKLSDLHADFLSRLRAFLDALSDLTGTHSFVDTSKSPEMALAFSLLEGVDTKVVNLARDPRAVAYSWYKKKKNLKAATRFSRLWAKRQQMLGKWAQSRQDSIIQVRYEVFAARPEECVGDILRWASLPIREGMFTSPNRAQISWENQHLFPHANESILRERKTDIEIIPADSWLRASPWLVRLLAIVYTYPLGWKYIRGEDAV